VIQIIRIIFFAAFFLLLSSISWGKPARKPSSSDKTFSIQVGAFNSLRKSAVIRSLLKNLGEVKVERIHTDENQSLYRVLLGNFKSTDEANEFAKSHQLSKLFEGVWINSVEITKSESEIIPPETLDQDPYVVHIQLYCEEKKKYGDYFAELQPDEKDSQRNVELKLSWNCIPNLSERWLAKDEERSPSHFFVTPLFGLGNVNASDSSWGSLNRFDLSYGVELGAFKSLGGMGPTFEYRILNHRLSGDSQVAAPEFKLTHRALLGARLPLSHRLEFQPLFGLFTSNFIEGTSISQLQMDQTLLSQLGFRATWHLLELTDRTWFNVTAGFSHLFGSTQDSLTIQSGTEVSLKFQARHFFRNDWGIDWFFEYFNHSQGTSSLQQSNSLVLVGVSALGPF
jgi:hypothetical protein